MQLQWVGFSIFLTLISKWSKFLLAVINPVCKLSWMEKHWSVQEVKNVKEWTIQTVSSYSNEDRSTILTNYAILTDAWVPHCSPSSNKPKAINRCCKHELASVCNCKQKWSTINPSWNLEVVSTEASHCQICCLKNRITIKHWIRFSTFMVFDSSAAHWASHIQGRKGESWEGKGSCDCHWWVWEVHSHRCSSRWGGR